MNNRINSFFFSLPVIAAAEDKTQFPKILGSSPDSLVYFHSHTTSVKELDMVREHPSIIEIDLAWAHRSFNSSVTQGTPYIGHPEEFYTKMGKNFPIDNVTLVMFQTFLKNNPAIKVLIDVKDQAVFQYLAELIKAIGSERCIVHAFIKDWTYLPEGVTQEPHWYREDIDLFALNKILVSLTVPLIANCRGFSNENIEQHNILQKMIVDSKKCKSIVSLGLYYPGAPLPDLNYLKLINQNGFYAWVNGNISQMHEKIDGIKYVAMSDSIMRCTKLPDNNFNVSQKSFSM